MYKKYVWYKKNTKSIKIKIFSLVILESFSNDRVDEEYYCGNVGSLGIMI
jgi:hypothetical protein